MLAAGLACACVSAGAQEDVANRPYRTFATTPAIVAGPLLLDVSDTSTAIIWMTDAPSDARVELGRRTLDRVVVPDEDGLVPVGTLHRVVIDGLRPGTRYRYRVASRRVVAMKAYWPDRGGTVESATAEFSTLDPLRERTRFAVIADTHEDAARVHDLMKIVANAGVDFVVHAGDSIDHADSAQQVRDGFIAPMSEGLGGRLPMLYARGNHETRGAFARELSPWLRAPEGGHSYTRRDGPVRFFVVDTGEDKPDGTQVYAGLNAMRQYRARELARFRAALGQPDADAAFRVALAHQQDWGWTGTPAATWSQAANAGRVDLMIAGHEHAHEWCPPGAHGKDFPTLVVGQDQVALVEADRQTLRIRVVDRAGKSVGTHSIQRRH